MAFLSKFKRVLYGERLYKLLEENAQSVNSVQEQGEDKRLKFRNYLQDSLSTIAKKFNGTGVQVSNNSTEQNNESLNVVREKFKGTKQPLTRKQKAMIATTAIVVGGGAFVGLLLPGLLAVTMAGLPVMAMSSNVVASGIVAGASGGIHYAVTRKDNKVRKFSKYIVNALKAQDKLERVDENSLKHTVLMNINKRMLKKADRIYEKQKAKYVRSLAFDNGVGLMNIRKFNDERQLDVSKASKRTKKIISRMENMYKNEEANKKEFSQRKNIVVNNQPSQVVSTPKQFQNTGLIQNLQKDGVVINPDDSTSNISVENSENVQKFKRMLNLGIPNLDENASSYEIEGIHFQKSSDRKSISKQSAVIDFNEKAITNCINVVDSQTSEFAEYLQANKYNLPMRKGYGSVNIEVEGGKIAFGYRIHDYQEFIAKPLFAIDAVIKLMENGKISKAKISTCSIDGDGSEIRDGLAQDYEVTSLEQALEIRNVIYSKTIYNLYKAQEVAYYDYHFNPQVSGLQVLQKVCDLAIPQVGKTTDELKSDADKVVKLSSTDAFTLDQYLTQNKYSIQTTSKNEVLTSNPQINY